MTDSTNLHRSLAPISSSAWQQIEEEAATTFKRHSAGRRVVDVAGPLGGEVAAVNTGRLRSVEGPDGIETKVRQVAPLVQLRVPFELSREEIDDVARGSLDSDWQPVKDAAATLAHAEDRAIFDGMASAEIAGLRPESSTTALRLPADARDYPDVIASAQNELRVAGITGPYALVLDAAGYAAVEQTRDSGYPILGQLERTIAGGIVWCPAITGGALISQRGGDFELTLGDDVSIGYLRHDDEKVRLYLQESFTFRALTAEASVSLIR